MKLDTFKSYWGSYCYYFLQCLFALNISYIFRMCFSEFLSVQNILSSMVLKIFIFLWYSFHIPRLISEYLSSDNNNRLLTDLWNLTGTMIWINNMMLGHQYSCATEFIVKKLGHLTCATCAVWHNKTLNAFQGFIHNKLQLFVHEATKNYRKYMEKSTALHSIVIIL